MELHSQELHLAGEEFVRLVGVLGERDARVLIFDAKEATYPEVPACVLVIGGMDCGQVAHAILKTVVDEPGVHAKNAYLLAMREAELLAQINMNAGFAGREA